MNSKILSNAFGYITENEIACLKEMCLLLPSGCNVVNIGAGAGTSGMAIMESRKDLFLYTIDIRHDASPLGCLEAEKQAMISAGIKFEERNKHITGDSKTVGMHWHDKIDFVFVDGAHEYENAKGDINIWWEHVKVGGYMAVHDFDKKNVFKGIYKQGQPHPGELTGVDKAVNEFRKNHEVFKIVDSTIVFKK